VLLPRVRSESLATVIVADGFSCREQIAQGTQRHALHLAEAIQLALRGDRGRTFWPEEAVVKPRRAAVRRSLWRAGLVTLGAILGLRALAARRAAAAR
jgi:hypothetical protein